MTRVLLTSNDSTQLQIPFSINCSYGTNGQSHIMTSNNQNTEISLQESLEQMTPASAPFSMAGTNTRPEQGSVMNTHHQQQNNNNNNNGNSMSLNMTNGNLGHHPHPHHHQNLMSSSLPSQTHNTLELPPGYVTNILELGEPETRPHMCQVCQATYKTRTHLRRHMFIHLTSRPYPCPDCGKGFNRKEHLNKHTEAVHSGTKYKCPYCSKEISRKDHLSRHIKNMHLATVGSQVQLRNVGEGESLPQSKKSKQTNSNKQSKLPRIFPSGLTITSLNQHSTTKLHGPGEIRYQVNPLNLDVQLGFGNSTHHNSTLDKKLLLQLYTCPDCSATFTSERDLSIHSRVHKPQPYKCNECTRAYTRREKLTEHVRCFHQGQKFSCEYCGKELSRKDHVLRHVRSVHPEVLATRFVAIAEGSNFDTTSGQIRTSNSTTPLHGSNGNNIPSMGEMGVLLRSVCHICLKVFGTSYHLCRHMDSIHNNDVRPYSCTNCSKQFKRKDHLTKHMKSHCPSMRDTSASAALRSMIRASNGDANGNDGLESSTMNGLDTAELMHQDAIDSLQIEMMTDADDDETDGSNSNDEDEDSKELPGLIVENTPSKNNTGENSIKKKKKVKSQTTPVNEFTLSGLKSSLLNENGAGAEGNENSLIHLQMDTTDSLRIQSTFPCGHCQKEFNSKNRLIQHLQEHSNSDLKIIQSHSNSTPKTVTVTPVTNTNTNNTSSEHVSVTNLWNS